jgi:hypothetical protein
MILISENSGGALFPTITVFSFNLESYYFDFKCFYFFLANCEV